MDVDWSLLLLLVGCVALGYYLGWTKATNRRPDLPNIREWMLTYEFFKGRYSEKLSLYPEDDRPAEPRKNKHDERVHGGSHQRTTRPAPPRPAATAPDAGEDVSSEAKRSTQATATEDPYSGYSDAVRKVIGVDNVDEVKFIDMRREAAMELLAYLGPDHSIKHQWVTDAEGVVVGELVVLRGHDGWGDLSAIVGENGRPVLDEWAMSDELRSALKSFDVSFDERIQEGRYCIEFRAKRLEW